ncbi:MAG: OsmC family protein [Chloroflexota bacterium]
MTATTATTAAAAPTRNGIDVDQLVSTVKAVQENPGLARFQFRAQSTWEGGARSRTTIQGFYGAGQEDPSRTQPFELRGDEPPVLLGTNTAPNAVETVLAALASCLAVGFVYNAAAQGITIEALDFELQGDLDLQGFLGLSDQVRSGFSAIALTARVRADAPRDQLAALWEYVQRTSPVLDIIRNPVPVTVALAD